MWYTEEDYLRTSRREAAFSWLVHLAIFLFLSNTFLFYLVHFDLLPLQDLLLKLTHIVNLFLSSVMFFITIRYRKEWSQIIRFANQLSWEILQMDNAREFRPMRNRVFLCIVAFRYFICIGALCGLLQYSMEPILHGRLFFGTFSPFGVVPLHVEACLHVAFLCCQIVYCVNFLVVIFEPLLIYSISFRVLADQLTNIRIVPLDLGEEVHRLKDVIRKWAEIRQCVLCVPGPPSIHLKHRSPYLPEWCDCPIG